MTFWSVVAASKTLIHIVIDVRRMYRQKNEAWNLKTIYPLDIFHMQAVKLQISLQIKHP